MRSYPLAEEVQVSAFAGGQYDWLLDIPFEQIVLKHSRGSRELPREALHLSASIRDFYAPAPSYI